MEKRRKTEKIHWKFAHVSKEKLISLVRGSKALNDKEFLNLIQDVCDSCSVYLRFRKPPLWPLLTLQNRFIDTECQDLKEHWHNQYWSLHLIKVSTRYSAARLIKTKSEELICNIFLMWIPYFGPQSRFLSGKEEELNNEGYWQMNKNWILRLALQLQKINSAMLLWNATIWY